MKFKKSRQDTRTRHEFELAGQPATIRADEFHFDLRVICTVVRVKGHDPVNGSLIGVLTPAEARRRMREIKRERKLGILRPDCRPGEIVDVRSPNYDLSIQFLCVQAGLDPDDCTDYDYVELTVRVAAMALARKITLMRRHKKRAHPRPVSAPITTFDPFEL